MKATRREILTGGTLALFGGGFLSRVDSVAAMQGRPAPSLTKTLSGQATGTSAALLLAPKAGAEGPPEPADYDRLPLAWNKRTVKRFRERLAEKDVEKTAAEPVPKHLRNATTALMREAGYGEGYRYAHDDPAARNEMTCLPHSLIDRRYFESGPRRGAQPKRQ